MRAVVAVHDAVEQATGIARGFSRRARLAVKHLHVHALAGQRARHRRTGQAGADHRHLWALWAGQPQRLPAGWRLCQNAGGKARQRDLGLVWLAGCLAQFEAGRLQALAQLGGRACVQAPGGQRGARGCQPVQAAQGAWVPGPGRGWRRKTSQVESIDLGHQLGQHLGHIAAGQQQAHPAGVEVQAVQVGRGPGTLASQHAAQRRQRRTGMRALQLGRCWRVPGDGQVDQAVAAPRILLPGGPGGQKVVTQAEAGLQHHESRAAGPAPGQMVATQELVGGQSRRAALSFWPEVSASRQRRPPAHAGRARLAPACRASQRSSGGRALPSPR